MYSRLRWPAHIKQSGCRGYCAACLKVLEPDAAAALQAKTKVLCKRCRRTPTQNGFEGYCKGCWPHRDEEAPTPECHYCLSRDAAEMSCARTEGCRNPVNLCGKCHASWGKAVCNVCWQHFCSSGCFACGAAMPTMQMAPRWHQGTIAPRALTNN